jgi:hypothetical protein
MSFAQSAKKTADELLAKMGVAADEKQKAEMTKAIEEALIQAALDEQQRCVRSVNLCCSADQDMAHKISDRIREHETTVIANLKGLL